MICYSKFCYLKETFLYDYYVHYFRLKIENDFDVEVAVNVCRQSSSEDALLLAKKHNLHSWYLKIQLEDNHQFNAALDYLSKLTFTEVNEISFFILYFCCKFIYNNIWSQF